MEWIQSSFCDTSSCVQAAWTKSSFSADSHCVEARSDENVILVRNSRFPDGPSLGFTRDEWTAFISGAKAGEFDAK
jgi:hypothetical protein